VIYELFFPDIWAAERLAVADITFQGYSRSSEITWFDREYASSPF